MPNLKKLKEADILWRKIILFAVLFVLAVPLIALVARRAVVRGRELDSQQFFEQLEVGEMKEEIGQAFIEMQDAQEKIKEQMSLVQETATTSTSTEFILSEVEGLSTGTSTDATSGTTTTESNNQ